MKQGYKATSVMAIAAILTISVIALVDIPEVEAKQSPKHFWAKINADQEVLNPEQEATGYWDDVKGKGIAHFKLSKDGSKMTYQIFVAKIKNVVGVHIHNGPHDGNHHDHLVDIVPTDVENPSTGKFFKKFGVITDADVLPLCEGGHGHGGHGDCTHRTVADLYEAMKNKHTYLQVHTDSDKDTTTSSGPGDLYTPGEVRGNIFPGRR